MYSLFQRHYTPFFRLAVLFLFGIAFLFPHASVVTAQDSTDVLVNRLIDNPDGSSNDGTPPRMTFTAWLNNNRDTVLLENAPRWQDDASNIQNGSFSLQLGNFPSFTAGDSVHIRMTDNRLEAQGMLHLHIDEIPWSDPNPLGALQLLDTTLPGRPDSLRLTVRQSGEYLIEWDANANLTYSVYRRTIQDTIFNGESRHLYTRVAQNISGGSYTDQPSDTDLSYAYIVYARNDAGTYSSHSFEISATRPIKKLKAEATPTTVRLTWNSYQPIIGEIGGYQIYRRKPGGSFGKPIAYTSTDTTYTDTRLQAGNEYIYRVEARNLNQEFFGLSAPATITTNSETSGYHKYATLKMAAIIYMKTGNGSITREKVESIKQQYERTRRFYWRNSGFRLNIAMDYFVVEEKVNLNNSVSISNVALQLKERGVYNTQYDLVFAAWPISSGFWSIGDGANLSLPGPDRNTGFAQTQLPCGNGVGYPIEPGEERCATWTYMHENQHTIGAIYGRMGTPMQHGDFPQAFPYPAGMHLDFQAMMFRVFDHYLNLKNGWGDIYEARDADGDDFPDHDLRAPFSETDFGSDPSKVDTDGDGLNDRAEAMAGIYWGSDPNSPHSDLDSVADGRDAHPRYPIDAYIKKLPETHDIQVDGDLSDWKNLDARVSQGVEYVFNNSRFDPKVYMTYSSDSLYIGLDLASVGLPEFRFDFESDGRWHGAGNTRIEVNISNGTFSEFRSWDARPEVRRFVDDNPEDQYPGNGMWDNTDAYQQEFRRYVFNPSASNVASQMDFPRTDVEISLPRNPEAGLHLVPGDSISWNINYGKVNNKPDNWATTFDQHSFVTFNLINQLATSTDQKTRIANRFRLHPNYPNPFNPTTRISYSITEAKHVCLTVYDLLGRKVTTLVNERQDGGRHSVRFDASNLSSGVYFYRLTAGDHTRVRKMTLVK